MRHRNEFKAAGYHYNDRSHVLRVVASGSHSVAVTVNGRGARKRHDTATVDVDALDLSRAVTAAADPDLNIESTVRGADGTVCVKSYPGFCDFWNRSYDDGGDARVDIRGDRVQDLCGYLDHLVTSHPLANIGDNPGKGSIPEVYETAGFNWANSKLTLSPNGDRIVVSAEESRRDCSRVETVTVPFESFANLTRLAGGDLPGQGTFTTMRGQLSFEYDRHAALKLYVKTDEVDGAIAIVYLDIEQVQELRRLVSAWRPPSISS